MKIVHEFLDVVEGGFDWVGLEVVERGGGIHISSGVIGRAENPISRTPNGQTEGGWPFSSREITLLPDDHKVDILRHKQNDELYILIRSFDDNEIYSEDTYEHFLTLLERDTLDLPWKHYRPIYRMVPHG